MNEEKPKLHSLDQAVLHAAQTGEGMIPLTEEKMIDIIDAISSRQEQCAKAFPKLVAECPYEMRLAVTAFVFEAIHKHAREGGSFRYLIYDRLGFNTDAYVPLYMAGGMDISNEYVVEQENKEEEQPREEQTDVR